MNFFEQYKQVRINIENRFQGLRHEQASLIKSLITLADPANGVVSNISYQDLAGILTVNPSPGRKISGTPSKQTIRNYIKSIEKEYGDYFQIISEGQSLKFYFPEIPKLFSPVFENTEVNTHSNIEETCASTGQSDDLNSEVNIQVNTEVNPHDNSVKNINNKYINNNNNNQKLPITDNFNPTPETIARAEALGYSDANDFTEIQAFIDHNKAVGSSFADFNPIYLRWLARRTERQQQQQQQKKYSRRTDHASSQTPTRSRQPSALERVRNAYSKDFELDETTGCFIARTSHATPDYSHSVASTY